MKLWMAPGGLHVEPARAEHIPAMAKLHAKSFFRGWSQDEFATYLLKPHQNPTFVACDSKQRVAGFMVLALSGEECELLTINVMPKWRKKGVGRAILRAGFQDIEAAGIVSMFLEVDQENASAIRMYLEFGFVEVGKREGYYPKKNGQRATALVMRANLD